MFQPDQYQLLDFGDGRKLERFGERVLDRPAPAAVGARRDRAQWSQADARYERIDANSGQWSPQAATDWRWTIAHERAVLELKPTPFGHVGAFAEQATNWDWLAAQIALLATVAHADTSTPPQVLNLFAYTGGSTLAAAATGAAVVHVDSAQGVVNWARRNAELSGLASAPIRWIVDDARDFVRRELRRGRQYQGVVLDPPSYGHGPRQQPWQIADDLPELLADCRQLLAGPQCFVLCSCHTPELDAGRLTAMLARSLQADKLSVTVHELTLESRLGGQLPCGISGYWTGAR